MKRTPLQRKKPLRSKKKQVPKEIRDHWSRVAKLGCVVTFSDEVQLHHIHGGSVAHLVNRGTGQKTSDWLVLPLHPRLHTGADGVDSGMGVARWEAKYGKQADYLQHVRQQIKNRHGYDIFEKAGVL